MAKRKDKSKNMAWEDILVGSLEEIKDCHYLEVLVSEMANRIEYIKKNIRTSDTYETWVDSMDNGISEVEVLFFSIIKEASRVADVSALELNIARVCERRCSIDTRRKELPYMVKECRDIVEKEISVWKKHLSPGTDDILRGLLYKGSIFQLFIDMICWIVDEASDKIKQWNMDSEQLLGAVCKSIGRFAHYIPLAKVQGEFDSMVINFDRKIENNVINHPIKSFLENKCHEKNETAKI